MKPTRVSLGLLVVMVLLIGAGAAHARPRVDSQPAVTAAEHGLLERAWSWMLALIGNGGAFIDPSGGDSGQSMPLPPGDQPSGVVDPSL
jgi:hypothetical protein